ncbi:ammonia-dependent NAD(+) synthetase [Planococcus kocurii]|uniref:NH(3)-dependent NAD(+) synthetase n=1 Tax=Planococcus kocurii TaxID=1374 RepID=A0ABM5WYL4_9BACL|nr:MULTISPECIES: ammonia-dependent NAD(+) synthetase [Planococcus]ALS79423.1 NAD(+) synthetase [Planococcus kocurii]KAA0957065.1 ammonia-dependent NAD(+) synthetase [Planococcus sp. ANT_H30]
MSTLQQRIIDELKVEPLIQPQQKIEQIVVFLKEYLKHHPFLKGYILGISGGQDSTLLGKLAQLAVNQLNEESTDVKYGFYAIRLPYGVQVDEHEAQDALEFIQPTKLYTINIKEAVDASERALENAGIMLTDFAKGNEKARERMKAQYSAAAMHSAAVLGTDHAAEAITGFYTKFGDGAADLTPLFGLNKRQGRAMLQELGCPEHLYMKIPTADLEDDKPALPDEVALGVTYELIDDYLEGKKIPLDAQEKLEGHYLRTQHKRHLPITIFDDFWK